jgi:hypothetical protein
MTLHPIPSEFPYTVYEESFVLFLSVQALTVLAINVKKKSKKYNKRWSGA